MGKRKWCTEPAQIAELCDDGLFFMWVTGRAMELGRELLEQYG